MKSFTNPIPKIIHYCWFGGKPLPESAEKCIASWKKYFPDYEIKRWDELNFNVEIIPYTQEAFRARKFAFVSDFARFWILYNYGGLYFDTDVEVIRNMDDIVEKGPFMGLENDSKQCATQGFLTVAAGLGLGATKGMSIYKAIIEYYENHRFTNPDGQASPETVVTIVTSILRMHGLKDIEGIQNIDGINIYPVDYFCPLSVVDGKLRITENTRSIHHYDQSWQSPSRKFMRKMALIVGGVRLKNYIKKVYYK